MHVHFVQHETFEAPGAYLDWAIQRNHTISSTEVYEKQPLPESIDNIDILIVMGGPQSPLTSKQECPHFDAQAEMDLIFKVTKAGKGVVGVCLGAQLIGDALGGKFEHSPEKEIGVLPITLTQEGLKDEKINHFGKTLDVGHWHNDMPGLTANSQVLATSKGCPRQIVKYDNFVYGFQIHMELNKAIVELLIAEELDFLTNNTKHKFVQKPDEIRTADYAEMNNKLFTFLDKLADSLSVKHL